MSLYYCFTGYSAVSLQRPLSLTFLEYCVYTRVGDSNLVGWIMLAAITILCTFLATYAKRKAYVMTIFACPLIITTYVFWSVSERRMEVSKQCHKKIVLPLFYVNACNGCKTCIHSDGRAIANKAEHTHLCWLSPNFHVPEPLWMFLFSESTLFPTSIFRLVDGRTHTSQICANFIAVNTIECFDSWDLTIEWYDSKM